MDFCLQTSCWHSIAFLTLKTYALDSFVSHFVGILVKVKKCIYGKEINLNITFELWMASKVETYLKDPKNHIVDIKHETTEY